MSKKYELYKKCKDTKLWYIRALVDLPEQGIKAGDVGGRIEREKNLSHKGTAWVNGNALVYGNARVSGTARVGGNARVFGNARVGKNALVSGNAQVYGNARVSKPDTCIFLPYLNYGITITEGHVKVGCQQYTFDEFYALTVNDYLGEGFSEKDYDYIHPIVKLILIKIQNEI
jgi:hypothetical protein